MIHLISENILFYEAARGRGWLIMNGAGPVIIFARSSLGLFCIY